MSFYLPVMFTLILNAFMLFGLDSEIQINITLGLAYSMFLFLYYLARKREADTTLLLSALAYWALLSFVLNAQSTVFIFNNELFIFSLIFNLFAALLIFVAVLRIATNLLISPLPLLLMSHSLLAVMMYFNDLSLHFFIYIYIASMLLLALLN